MSGPPPAAGSHVLTPTVRTTARRWLFWIAAALFTLLLALVSMAIAGAGVPGAYLSPENAAPAGGRAVAEVLRSQGVDVRFTENLSETLDAAEDSESATVLLYDEGLLDREMRERLAGTGADLIVVNPGQAELDDLAPGVELGDTPDGVLRADCRVPAVQRAGEVTRATEGYTLTDTADRATTCLEGESGSFSLVQLQDGDRTVTVLGAGDALTNEFVVEQGNAALALGLLGRTDVLVWYLPGLDDVAAPPSLGELSPRWVTPSVVLLALTVLAAAFWRGRRLGPLVVENLPVVVRASETMEGRARLYQRSSARRRALDALRVGTVSRLASALRLGRSASVDDVAWATAERTGRDPQQVRHLLLDADPATDGELVRLSDDLLVLERDLRAALATDTRPSG
ncbi:DUF4350 domain-containing protein [Lysobacter korlensis]|uniref:DUF4350 domain-containing protein n=1 Tax=Lysobacter korlensis TaxID=553636 RepID=A0ABV6RWL4_9GAMM